MHNFRGPKRPSAGWSSHGQPVDQLHAQYRHRIRQLDLQHCHMHADLTQRPSYEDLPLRASGASSLPTCGYVCL